MNKIHKINQQLFVRLWYALWKATVLFWTFSPRISLSYFFSPFPFVTSLHFAELKLDSYQSKRKEFELMQEWKEIKWHD